MGVKNIIRQNKKAALQEFLFGSQDSIALTKPPKDFEAKIEKLQNQVNSLQQKVIELETKVENQNLVKDQNLNVLSEDQNIRFKSYSNLGQGDSTLEVKKDDSRLGNQSKNAKVPNDISVEELSDNIKRGFQLNQEGKLSLKNYYEGKGKNTFFESKGYTMRYESIQRLPLYKNFKEKM